MVGQVADPSIQVGVDQMMQSIHRLGVVGLIVLLVVIVVVGLRARHQAMTD